MPSYPFTSTYFPAVKKNQSHFLVHFQSSKMLVSKDKLLPAPSNAKSSDRDISSTNQFYCNRLSNIYCESDLFEKINSSRLSQSDPMSITMTHRIELPFDFLSKNTNHPKKRRRNSIEQRSFLYSCNRGITL